MTASEELPASPFDEYIGTEFGETGAERASARLKVADHHKQPAGVVHGGVHATVAESVASRASHAALLSEGLAAFGQTSQISFLRPIADGHLNVEAQRRHKGRTTWVWEVEISDDQGRLCSLVRVTVAIRPLRGA